MSARGGQRSAWSTWSAASAFGAATMFALQAGVNTLDDEALYRAATLGAFALAAAIGWLPGRRVDPSRAASLLGGALVALGVGASTVLIALDATSPLSARAARRPAQPLALAALSAAGTPLEPICARGLPSVPYERKRERVLLGGFGNGIEFACALQRGARVVDIAEPDAALRAGALAAGATQLAAAAHAQLRWHASSARALATRMRAARYDLILLPATPDLHTWPAGLLPIAEDTLRTDRSLSTLLSTLAPKGELFAVVSSEPVALRFTNTALLALRNAGVQRPEHHLIVHQSGESYGITLQVTPFELDDILELHQRARARTSENPAPELDALLDGAERLPQLRYAPGSMFQNRIGELFAQADHPDATLTQRYAFDIAPLRDERPLPAEWNRRDRPETWTAHASYRVLAEYVLWALVFAIVLAVTHAWARGTRSDRSGTRAWLALAALGCAQALTYAWSQHVLAIWLARPAQAFALNLFALFCGAGAGLVWGTRVLGSRGQPARRALGIAVLSVALIVLVFDRALVWASASGTGSALALPLAGCALVALGFALALPAAVALDRAAQLDPPRPLAVLLPPALAAAVAVPLSATLVLFSGYTALAVAAVSALTLAMLIAPRQPA